MLPALSHGAHVSFPYRLFPLPFALLARIARSVDREPVCPMSTHEAQPPAN